MSSERIRRWLGRLLRPRRALLASILGLALIAISAPANARLKIGTEEEPRHLQDVTIKGQNGEELYLGHLISIHWLGLPYSMSDEGYIIGIRGNALFYRIKPHQIARWQASGQLPDPMPSYRLSLLDYVFGHLLWCALLLAAAWRTHRYFAPAPPSETRAAEAGTEARVEAEAQPQMRAKSEPPAEAAAGAAPIPIPAPVAHVDEAQVTIVHRRSSSAAEPPTADSKPAVALDDLKSMPVARVICRVKQPKAA